MKWAGLLGLVALAACVPLHDDDDVAIMQSADVEFMQLEEQTSAVAFSQCFNSGGSHTRSFTGGRFDVSGQGEWIVAEGPTGTAGTPYWTVQTYQGNWRSCGGSNPEVTAIKDVAIQCGSWMALASSPPPVDGCVGNFGYTASTQLFTRFFVKGTDSSGKVYDGSNIYSQLNAGQSVVFPDGSIDVLQVGCKSGCRFDEDRTGGSRCLGVSVKCAGTETIIHLEKNALWDGGSMFNVYVRVPRDSPASKIRCGTDVQNLQGGYCGCWQGNSDGSLQETIRAKFEACVGFQPQFFDPSDLRTCRKPYFMATDSNSLFLKFNSITTALGVTDKYSLDRNPNQAVAVGTKATVQAQQTVTDLCKGYLSQVLGFSPDWGKTTDPRLFTVITYLADCIADTLNGLEWDVSVAKRMFCEVSSFKIQEERRDIYCAYKTLDSKLEKIDPDKDFGDLLKNARTADDVVLIRQRNADALGLAKEVQSSLGNIKFWYVPGCDSLIADSEDLVEDCVNHQFVDTTTLTCAPLSPVANSLWDKNCTSRLSGDKCVAKCSSTSTVYPKGTQTPATFTCVITASASKTVVSWEPDTPFQCCKGGCEKHPTKILTGLCESGQLTCKDCPVAQAASNGVCVDVACPANSAGFPECKCNAGFAGTLSWNANTGTWAGSCVALPCPTNAVNSPACICGVGSYGALRWDLNQQKWIGTCTICTDGFSNSTGLGKCLACTTCDPNFQVEVAKCESTKDRVCACKPGVQSREGKCEECPQRPGEIIMYKDTIGDTSCKACTLCNSKTELVKTACTPTSDTVCNFIA